MFNFEKDTERIFDKLSKELKKINKYLTFEFGPKVKGKREFVISAGGIKVAFPIVEKLYEKNPNLKKWKFIKFRPKRESMPLRFRGKEIYKDENKVGVILFFNDYTEKDANFFGHVGFLFLDQELGEYDVSTKVGFIESRFY